VEDAMILTPAQLARLVEMLRSQNGETDSL
jgi:hypothetical protein